MKLCYRIARYSGNSKYWKLGIALLIIFIYGLYRAQQGIAESPEARKARLIAKQATDAGQKCDTTDLNKRRNQDLKQYKSVYTFLQKDVNKLDIYDETEHVLGFLHIQKTAGSQFASFVNSKTEKIDNEGGVKRRINTKNAMFYLLCGLHSDWKSVQGCVEKLFPSGKTKMRAMIITMLRDPVDRYISEWLHINRGSTWLPTMFQCSMEDIPHMEKTPACIPKSYNPMDMFPIPDFDGKGMLSMVGGNLQRWAAGSSRYAKWEGVTLDDFIACPDNPATNRMVHMLADYSVLGEKCNGSSLTPKERGDRLLGSALDNLKELSFFGLTEHINMTQHLFKVMLGIDFHTKFKQREENHVACTHLTEKQKTAVNKLNNLDIQLYSYAKDLFYERLKTHNLL